MEGVEKVEIDFAAKTAAVSCGEEVNPAALLVALENAGFGGTIAK